MSNLLQALSMVQNPNRADVAALRPLVDAMTAQGMKNMATRAPTVGLYPVDALAMALQGLGVNMPLEGFVGTSDWAQKKMGGDPSAPESMMTDFLTPDPMDAARVATHAPDLIGAMTVFHGSPHKWDKVDLSKVGTGEGAQAYGHGFYAAESPDVAEGYRKSLTPTGKVFYGDTPLDEIQDWPIKRAVTEIDRHIDAGASPTEAAALAKQQLSALANDPAFAPSKEGFSQAVKRIDEIDPSSVKRERGHLYELDLPDETIGKMLDWDKPLSEQPESVRKALEGLDVSGSGRSLDDWLAIYGDSGNAIYKAIGNTLGDDAAASARLRELGIPGIKYLDGTSRSAGEGTRNFVVFDEQYITPLKRNGESLREAIEAQIRNQ